MNKPYITVYVLNKNYSQFLKQCIDSLLCQTCSDFELIVIDNKSDDDSVELIKSEYPQLNCILLEKSLRLTEVGNMVASIAKGSYFVRLDADDWVTEDFIEQFYNKLDGLDDVAAIFPNYHEVNMDGHIIKTVKRFDFDSEVSLFDLPAHGACTLLSKKHFLGVGGYDGALDRQDGYDLWLKLIKNNRVSNISAPLFFYRQHNLNLTKSQKNLLKVRTDILYKHAVNNGLDMNDYLFVIPVRKYDDFFGQLSKMVYNGKTLLNNLIDKIISINPNAVICLSSEDSQDKFSTERDILFSKRSRTNLPMRDSIIEAHNFASEKLGRKFGYVATITIDYPFLDAHYILSAVSYINYFETYSVDSVCIEDSLLFKHYGDSLRPVYNNTVTSFERDTLYRKSGGINIIRTDKFDDFDGISTKRSGHIVIDKLSALRFDNIEIIDFILMNNS